FNPNSLSVAGSGETKLLVVTTEGDRTWVVNSLKDASGNAISWLTATTDSSPAASGNNLTITAQANTATPRTAYVRVESRATISKPLMVEQEAINTDPGEAMTIGGVTWSKYNLANPKQADGGATFATKQPSELSGTRLESHGKFYQWGINVAWNTTGASASGATPGGSWQTSTSYPSDWNTQPCPDGYRLPTNTEYQNLIDNCTRTDGGGWSSSDYGYITLTLKTDSSKKLEFPAVGYRSHSDGSLYPAGQYGSYWSSVTYTSLTNSAYNLYFNSGGVSPQHGWNKRYGLSVRCVKDIVVLDEVEMGDLKWTTHNLANPRQASGGATFATKLPSECSGTRAESHGKFYQWGINVAWNTTGSSASGATPSGSWNRSTYPADWNIHPCPDGYRLPTNTEYQNLIDNCTRTNGGGWSTSDYGYITLTLKTDSSKKLEFPAVGSRYTSGTLVSNVGAYGYYWSSVAYDSNSAYYLYFGSSSLGVNYGNKQGGFSVRCVRQ
ncbi:MAG: hypothetical protein K2N21_08520, partial [Rikenellaceae bacterium]|nr:hypothetical protein [Rikenellaceae bacterium]